MFSFIKRLFFNAPTISQGEFFPMDAFAVRRSIQYQIGMNIFIQGRHYFHFKVWQPCSCGKIHSSGSVDIWEGSISRAYLEGELEDHEAGIIRLALKHCRKNASKATW